MQLGAIQTDRQRQRCGRGGGGLWIKSDHKRGWLEEKKTGLGGKGPAATKKGGRPM